MLARPPVPIISEPVSRVLSPKIAIITTLHHNVGDDFVRDGIIHLLDSCIHDARYDFIHKHIPVTAVRGLGWLQTSRFGRDWIRGLKPKRFIKYQRRFETASHRLHWPDRIRGADLLVQSGAPVYWINQHARCENNEWWQPLIELRHARARRAIPFVSLAGGTCQPFGSDASEFAGQTPTLDYVRSFRDLTALTTLRDRLSAKVMALAGRSAPVLPCTSIFAVDHRRIAPRPSEYYVFNYMQGGGHYSLGQPIDENRWLAQARLIVERLGAKAPVVMTCHDEKELRLAKTHFPANRIFHSESHVDYLEFYSRAIGGVLNRVHAGFALASLGKPVYVVGTDSRAEMTEMIEVPSCFVSDADPERILAHLATEAAAPERYPARLAAIKSSARSEYLRLLREALPGLCR